MPPPEVEDVDFERDSNQGSFMQKESKKEKGDGKEKRFLMTELKQIKDSLYAKLTHFKAKTQGKKHPSKAKQESDAGLFEILSDSTIDEILRKEIDHFFVMTQMLNSIVLKGDETYRTMQELAKLTNDQD